MIIPKSDLVLNDDGSVYHLALRPEDIADVVITVGDPDRVAQVSQFFDSVEIKKQKREFITHTGYLDKLRITVLSTGVGIGNIDIVMNELDALVNLDFATGEVKKQRKSLIIVRIGTAGGIQETIAPDSWVVSKYAIGFDGLADFYPQINTEEELSLQRAFNEYFNQEESLTHNYVSSADKGLLELFKADCYEGITATFVGFYAPQDRHLRLPLAVKNELERFHNFSWQNHHFVNFEMETAAICKLSNLLGHKACSLSTILFNRITKEASVDIKRSVERLIEWVLQKLHSDNLRIFAQCRHSRESGNPG